MRLLKNSTYLRRRLAYGVVFQQPLIKRLAHSVKTPTPPFGGEP